YGERPASWIAAGRASTTALWAGNLLTSAAPLDPNTSYVFVRYVGRGLDHWGISYEVRLGARRASVILINQERPHDFAGLLPERRAERATLVPEYGHLLGLPPADHAYYPYYPDLTDGAHCINPSCALSKPRPRALLYGILNAIFRRRFLED